MSFWRWYAVIRAAERVWEMGGGEGAGLERGGGAESARIKRKWERGRGVGGGGGG